MHIFRELEKADDDAFIVVPTSHIDFSNVVHFILVIVERVQVYHVCIYKC